MGDPRGARDDIGRRFRTLFDLGAVGHRGDGELLERFADGRGEAAELAFAALLERHGPMVLRACRRVLGDAHEAEDAFQATFLVLARRARAVRRRDSIAGWLHAVALRVAAAARKAAGRRRERERDHAVAHVDRVTPPPDPDDVGAAVHEELGRLPCRFREVAVLCLLEGRSYQEAANRLGCPVGTVRSRLATARQRLRFRLERRGLAPTAALATIAFLARTEAACLPRALLESTGLAATRVAAYQTATIASGTVPAGVAALADGVIRAMILAKLKLAAAAASALLICLVGAAWAQAPAQPAGDTPSADRLDQLERKLDRVLEALEGGDRRPPPPAGADVSYPRMGPGQAEAIYRTGQPVPVPAGYPVSQPTNPPQASNVPQGNTVRRPADVAVEPPPQADRPDSDAAKRLERRLEELERRVARLEELTRGDSADAPARP